MTLDVGLFATYLIGSLLSKFVGLRLEYTEWHKKRELLKNPTKIEENQEKKLLTEIEPLQLAF